MSFIVDWFGVLTSSDIKTLLMWLIPVAISFYALITSQRNQKRMVKIEQTREQDRLLQMQKANLIAQIKREVLTRGKRSVNQYVLRVDNTGNAEARDIVIMLDGKPLLEHPTILKNEKEIRQVGPNSHFQYVLAQTMQARPPSDLRITWSDDSGKPSSYQTTLTL